MAAFQSGGVHDDMMIQQAFIMMCTKPLIWGSLAVLLSILCGAASAQNYGAIAYDPVSGGYGYSYDYETQWDAEAQAYSECSAQNGNCQGAVWFVNACGAVAAGPDGWGSGWGDDRWIAEAEAMAVCRQYSYDCVPMVWACTTR